MNEAADRVCDDTCIVTDGDHSACLPMVLGKPDVDDAQFHGGYLRNMPADARFRAIVQIQGAKRLDRAMTIYFAAAVEGGLEVPSAAALTDMVAQIKFGASSTNARVDVDVQQGTRVVLVARQIWINIRTETADPAANPVSIGCFIAFGTPALPTSAHRTLRIGALAPGNTSAPQVIPNFAAALDVTRTAALAITIRFLDRTGAVVGEVSAPLLGGPFTGLVVPHDATSVTLTNDSGVAALTNARLAFELDL